MTSSPLPFWGHVEELRKTLILSLFSILFGSLIAFFFHEPLLQLLLSPLEKSSIEKKVIQQQRITSHATSAVAIQLPEGAKMLSPLAGQKLDKTIELQAGETIEIEVPKSKLSIFNPLEGFLISFKLSVWTGCLVSSPLWLFFLLQFLLPALKTKEKRFLFPFILLSILFICGGVCFAYSITLPVVTTFFAHFNEGIGENVWHLGETLNFAMGLVVVHGIVFELFVILLLLIYYDMVSVSVLTRIRPKLIVAVFIVAAILTPPDIFSQLLLVLPMLALYEIAVLLAKFRCFFAKQ